MSLKRLLKKYNKIRRKAIKIHQKIEEYYAQAYLNHDSKVCIKIFKTLYGTTYDITGESKCVKRDTDTGTN